MAVRIGTCGWQYKHWSDVLYPRGTPQRLWLETYAAAFGTVEADGTFYRLPKRETFEQWRARTPEGFVFAVKASRYLTHVKRLRDPQEPVERMMAAAAAGLGPRLGPILLQLPPTLPADPGALDACLRCFPPGQRIAVEPRHETWWVPEVRAVLERRGAALCWADRRSRAATPLWRTADWGYLRLHEGAGSDFRYGTAALTRWMAAISDAWPTASEDVYVYFNNDMRAAAVHDARAFAATAARAGLTPDSR